VSFVKAAAAASEQTIEEEMGLAGAVADDAEAECIRRITETQVVTGKYEKFFNLVNICTFVQEVKQVVFQLMWSQWVVVQEMLIMLTLVWNKIMR